MPSASVEASGSPAASDRGTATQRARKVLLVTNAELGQANVFLAVADTLLHAEEDVEIHLASFGALRPCLDATAELARRTCTPGRDITFHLVRGVDMKTAWNRPAIVGGDGRPGLKGWKRLHRVILPWTGPEFVEILDSVVDIINHVEPDVVAVDPCLSPALTACRHLGVNFLVLSPNTIKDFAIPAQPALRSWWKYPCVGSGIPYPVPALLTPINFVLTLVSALLTIGNEPENEVGRFLRQVKGPGVELLTLRKLVVRSDLGIKILVANRPELEYPLAIIPPYIIPCGPMLRPAKALSEVDPNLSRWLERGPTIYVNLGTHHITNKGTAMEMAMALKSVLDESRSWSGHRLSELQVLWKLATDTEDVRTELLDCKGELQNVIGRYLDMDIIRIVSWLDAEPSVILEHKNTVLSVHHGGANSFLETASAGKPHVVLPCWLDTFDFANRAELAGIGTWGNRKNWPDWKANELGPILRKTLLGTEAQAMVERAQAMAQLCKEDGAGRFKAARLILAEASSRPCKEL